MNKITISKAKVSESQKIRNLENKVWKEEVTNKYDAPMFVWFGYVFVAKHNNKIIGAIISYPTNNNEVYVGDWIVDKEYRNNKIGQKLYNKLIKEVKEKAIVSFINPKNVRSLETHKKLGFKIIKKVKLNYGGKVRTRYLVRRKKSYKP